MEDIEAIRKRLEAVMPPPWENYHWLVRKPHEERDEDGVPFSQVIATTIDEAHAVFLSHAPTDIAFLLSALATERARADEREREIEAIAKRLNTPVADLRDVADIELENAALLTELSALRACLSTAQERERAMEKMEERIAALVSDHDDGLYLDDESDWCCVYCNASSCSASFVAHGSDCPIILARAALAPTEGA